jgi:catechol 2,3-dioxygenase-like lactoylglutathione lyase family enzyme
MPVEAKIDVGIVVRDAERSLAFYRDALGMEYLGRADVTGGYRDTLGCGRALIKLMSLDSPPEAANPPGGSRGATGLRYITLTTLSLQETVDRCMAGGYQIAIAPKTMPSGNMIAMVVDPEGNWVELLTPADIH